LTLVSAVLALLAAPSVARAMPVSTSMTAQRISLQVKRAGGTGVLLPKGLQAKVIARQLQWNYIPDTTVSVPYVQIQLAGFPVPNPLNVLLERSEALPSGGGGKVLTLPLLRKRNVVRVTVVDPEGRFEDWTVSVNLKLTETTVYVDETCRDYVFKIRELRRTSEASLIYLGCQLGSGPGDMSLEMTWSDLDRIEYRGTTIRGGASVMSLPLESRRETTSELSGFLTTGGSDVFQISYEPFIAPPYELWGGIAFFHNTFAQSNFPAKYNQNGTAFLGQFWFRPEDVRLSVMARGFGTLLTGSPTLEPAQDFEESVRSYFMDVELRYAVVNTESGWRVDPFVGGWAFFQTVQSRKWGVQRILDPILGVMIQKKLGKRHSISTSLRFVPLQTFFNPLKFSLNNAYLEAEFTFVHSFRRAHKLFGTVYVGSLNYHPENEASSAGTYIVAGGGFGW
jgi:hypothetical protein